MGNSKRKRGHKPKNPTTEILDLPTTSTAPNSKRKDPSAKDDVFSVGNVDLIEHYRRRHKKSTNHSDKFDKAPAVSTARQLTQSADSDGDFTVPGDTGGSGAVAMGMEVDPAWEIVSGDNDGDFTVPVHTGGSGAIAMDMQVDPAWKSVSARVVLAMDSVVKVFCVHSQPNFSLPWQRKRQYSSSSSGFVISGRRVLTNAHSVEHYTQVKLKKRGSDTKYLATVLAIGTECDIAMLTVEDDEFWHGMSPVEFGDLPALQDAVIVVGYPIGGDTISVTSGVVSRIEILSYVHGSAELLGLQIDAAINSGNSGGPAFNDTGNCVGIAFQSIKHEDVENIGYVIPTPVIMHFIRDYEKNGAYKGFPVLGIEWQKMENPDLRMAMGMRSNQKGVRIKRIDPTAREYSVLKPSDVILSFDGVDVANDGTVPFRLGERINFSYLISQKYTEDKAVIRVL